MRIFTLLLALTAAAAVGVVIGYGLGSDETKPKPESPQREILYWVAPMDPNFRRDEPGKSPMGMDLVPVYADDGAGRDSAVVTIEPHVVNNLGVRTAAVEFGALTRRIQAPGYVRIDEDSITHIHTRVDGWIEGITLTAPGERVSKGQTLFELYSPALVSAQEEYLTAIGTGNRGLIEASRNRLESLGLSGSRLDTLRKTGRVVERVPLRAADDGIVESLNVRAGMYVQPSTTVMSLYRLDRVWLIAELFESDSAWIRSGSDVSVVIDALPDRVWSGAIDYIYPELHPVKRTLRARVRLANPDEVLRPNMYARVSIEAASVSDALHIPRAALIRGAQRDRVVVALGDGRYESRIVERGLEAATRVQIRHGLVQGERVVVSGQFLIDSESNIATDLARAGQDGDGR